MIFEFSNEYRSTWQSKAIGLINAIKYVIYLDSATQETNALKPAWGQMVKQLKLTKEIIWKIWTEKYDDVNNRGHKGQ